MTFLQSWNMIIKHAGGIDAYCQRVYQDLKNREPTTDFNIRPFGDPLATLCQGFHDFNEALRRSDEASRTAAFTALGTFLLKQGVTRVGMRHVVGSLYAVNWQILGHRMWDETHARVWYDAGRALGPLLSASLPECILGTPDPEMVH